MTEALQRLRASLGAYPRLVVAVSGGVDSLTLATVATQVVPDFSVAHAVSPAVPKPATDRVRQFAHQQGWKLHVIDAGEFKNPDYLKNPINRCYFCKSNLYKRIAETCAGPIAAGTNTDDLGEYRPGLIAASENQVLHPYLDAQISKMELRIIASELGLSDIAALPAQPCLASRIETGIAVTEEDLVFAFQMEELARSHGLRGNVRCRITRKGVKLETSEIAGTSLMDAVKLNCTESGRKFAGHAPYQRGSAFVGPASL